MRSQNRWTAIVMGVVSGVLFSAAVVLAGDLEPSVGPTAAGSQMYTLDQIYDRLNTGAAGTKRTSFTEPNSGPASTGRTLDEIMGKLPALDNGNGAGPANVAAGKTYWGLTSGEWGLKTGTYEGGGSFTAPVARTGQTPTVPFAAPAGSDGDFQKGVAWPNPRFTVNANWTVTDNLTGLIWLRDANCTNFFSGDLTGVNRRTWDNALIAANSLRSGNCGLTDSSAVGDWRLPNVKELLSLIDWAFSNPALSNAAGTAKWATAGDAFIGVQSNTYWSSTTYADSTGYAWVVPLYDGGVFGDDKTVTNYVWPVRGGQGR
jgi:hypothetical protein